jgi:hypothetical protein
MSDSSPEVYNSRGLVTGRRRASVDCVEQEVAGLFQAVSNGMPPGLAATIPRDGQAAQALAESIFGFGLEIGAVDIAVALAAEFSRRPSFPAWLEHGLAGVVIGAGGHPLLPALLAAACRHPALGTPGTTLLAVDTMVAWVAPSQDRDRDLRSLRAARQLLAEAGSLLAAAQPAGLRLLYRQVRAGVLSGQGRASAAEQLLELAVALGRLRAPGQTGFLVEGVEAAGGDAPAVEEEARDVLGLLSLEEQAEEREEGEWPEGPGSEDFADFLEEDDGLPDQATYYTPAREQGEAATGRPKYVDAYATDMKKLQEYVKIGKGQQAEEVEVEGSRDSEELIPLESLQLVPGVAELEDDWSYSSAVQAAAPPAGAPQEEGPVLGSLERGDGTRLAVREGCLLGRGPDCHLRLPGSEVSRQHAQLRAGGPGVAIELLSKTNKLHVAGREVRGATFLKDGDTVQVKVQGTVLGDKRPQVGKELLVWRAAPSEDCVVVEREGYVE